jgi:ribulose 1,5-bisphosphate synthetase/thiazole synthase
MRRHLLEAFAKKLTKEDVVVVEATGDDASVAAVIAPHVKKVVIANAKQVHHRSCEDQNRYDRRQLLAQLYASGFARRAASVVVALP